MDGWIKCHRSLSQHPLWLEEKFTRGQAWLDLIMLANHKAGRIRRRGIKVNVRRGEVGYALRYLAERWKWSLGKVQRFIDELKEEGQIHTREDTEKINVTTLICITNYEKYQIGDTETIRKQNGNDTETGTEQERKKEKEEREKTIFEVINYLNQRTGKKFKPGSSDAKKYIPARLKEGYELKDFFAAIDNQAREWIGTEYEKFLRPSTLFSPEKFGGYVNNGRGSAPQNKVQEFDWEKELL